MAILSASDTARALAAALLISLLIGCAAPADRGGPNPRVDAPASEPQREQEAESEPEARPVPEPEPVSEPVSEPEPVPEPKPTPEPEAELVRAVESDPAAGSAPESAPVPEEPTPEPVREPEPAPEPEPAAVPEPASASLIGRVTLSGGDAAVDQTVVYFVPDNASAVQASIDSTPEIVTRNKVLDPTVLVVPAGTAVRFPNRDPILHNLFSLSPGNQFDLGIYGPGDAPSATLNTPGTVNIFCNVHHDMHAHVLVVDTPFHMRAEADGRFELTGLPIGSGTLHAWHRQGPAWSSRIDLPTAEPVAIALEITRPNLPPHRDKRGQSYQRRDRDPYR